MSQMAWDQIQMIDTAQMVADHDISALEAVIDVLLSCDIANEDPYSLCMHNYLQILQPLQLALEYTWDLYSRNTAMHRTTTRCLTAATAFKAALQQYAKAAQAEIDHVAETQMSHAGRPQCEHMRAQLRPLKKLHDAMRAALKAEEAFNQHERFVFRSRRITIGWAALHSVRISDLDNGDSLEALCSVLPMLAYGDISQVAWQELPAGDCVHFIQLAQRAVRYMLSEADAAHMSLQGARQQLAIQERGAKRVYHHSRNCFHQLKQVQQADRLPAREIPSSDEAERAEMQAEPSVLPAQRADVETQVQAAMSQPVQPRPFSPVKGGQVRYRASTESPIVVQGCVAALASDSHVGAEAVGTGEHSSVVQDMGSHEQGGSLEATQEGGVSLVTQQLEDLWAVMAAFDQDASLVAHEEAASAPDMNWDTRAISMPEPAQGVHTSIHNSTSVRLDLEALKAVERRHAEARIRATFADIKQKAFLDISQQLNSSSAEPHAAMRQDRTLRSALSGAQSVQGTPRHAGITKSIQHFSTSAPVSQMVKHLRSSSGIERLSSSNLPKQSRFARPPKAAGFQAQATSQSSQDVDQLHGQPMARGRPGAKEVPLSMYNASLASNGLMRLTSCVKLDKSGL
ncbi:hypothetical protein WJX77_009924 [Trebouxia sp. C0004]